MTGQPADSAAPVLDSGSPRYRHPGQRRGNIKPTTQAQAPAVESVAPEPAARYVSATACVIVKGRRGSHGTFYESQPITPWHSADSDLDEPDPADLARLEALGFVRKLPA